MWLQWRWRCAGQSSLFCPDRLQQYREPPAQPQVIEHGKRQRRFATGCLGIERGFAAQQPFKRRGIERVCRQPGIQIRATPQAPLPAEPIEHSALCRGIDLPWRMQPPERRALNVPPGLAVEAQLRQDRRLKVIGRVRRGNELLPHQRPLETECRLKRRRIVGEKCPHRLQHRDGVKPLAPHLVGGQPMPHGCIVGRLCQAGKSAVSEVQALHRVGQGITTWSIDDARLFRRQKSVSDIDHRVGLWQPAGFGWCVDHRDFVIVLEWFVVAWPAPVAIRGIDPADAAHTEPVQFGGAQGAHARRAKHVNALRQRPEDFAVPYRGHIEEDPIDDADRARRRVTHHAIDVPLPDGRQISGRQHRFGVASGKCRPQEHHRPHERARAPGVYSPPGGVHGPSRPGMMTRATGMPNAGCVRSTHATCRMPAVRRRFSASSRS